ncbi:MAG: NADH-quinone oxidoreductase subunit A [Pelagibacterales bacterium]|nr:NADH-quinone oxidoreductase subunit A [Pelagibacterales bacterium]
MKSYFLNLKNISLLKEELLPVFVLLMISIIITILILSLSYILAVQNPETEKLSSYECGFEPYEDARHKFSVNFYLVAILFIIFDIEAMFLFPWSASLSNIDLVGFWSMIDFIIELGVGFIYILYVGALDWSE